MNNDDFNPDPGPEVEIGVEAGESTPDEVSVDDAPAFVNIPVLRGWYEIEPLAEMVFEAGGYICGGYVRWMCSPRRYPDVAGDVDIFSPTQAIFDNINQQILDKGFVVKYENEVSLSYTAPEQVYSFDTDIRWSSMPRLQLIKPQTEGAIVTEGSLLEILSNFDFTVVRIGMDGSQAVEGRQSATADGLYLHDERKHLLRLKNIHCPVSSLLRALKYGRKGYSLRPREAMRLFTDWDSRTPEYRARMQTLFNDSEMGSLNRTEIDELERLLRID